MRAPLILFALSLALAMAGDLRADEDLYLPLPEMEPMLDVQPRQPVFLKPTKSIKPPVPSAAPTSRSPSATSAPQDLASVLPTVNSPTTPRLRRLILVPGGNMAPQALQSAMLASGQSAKPVTMMDVDTPATILAELAELFGKQITADTGRAVIDTVRKGLDKPESDRPRRVEFAGWLPKEGVMAVAVYPEGS